MVQITATGSAPLYMELDFADMLRSGAGILTRLPDRFVVGGTASNRFVFTGENLVYGESGWPVSGTVTGFEYSLGGQTLYSQSTIVPSLPADGLRDLAEHPAEAIPALLPGNDVLTGSGESDLIVDSAGHNVLYGRDGNDALRSGNGNDHLYGGSPDGGRDGNDDIDGGGGNDYIQGNAGNDALFGRDGSDRINGGADNDTIIGGNGHDTINGNRGNDALSGDDGNDSLRGGQGTDTLYGGNGNDVLAGDLGADELYGGSGADIFSFGPGSSPIGAQIDAIKDYQSGVDHIALGFNAQAMYSDNTSGPNASDHTIEMARAKAQALFDANAGSREVAIIGGGTNILVFWSSNGGDSVDSMASIAGDSFSQIGLGDFIF